MNLLNRFINLISHLGQVDLRHQPISVIAELVGIPDWLVNIRHEATHAKMPALGVLRTGMFVYPKGLMDIHLLITNRGTCRHGLARSKIH